METPSLIAAAFLGISTLVIILANIIIGIVAKNRSTIFKVAFLTACIYVTIDNFMLDETPWLIFIFQGPFNIFQVPPIEFISLGAAILINSCAGLAMAYIARGITVLVRKLRKVKDH